MSKQAQEAAEPIQNSSSFVPLLNGAEKPELVQLRETLFQESWAKIDERIEVSERAVFIWIITKNYQGILKTSNLETLHEVSDFIKDAETDW